MLPLMQSSLRPLSRDLRPHVGTRCAFHPCPLENHPTSDRIGSRAISRIVQERANAAGFDEYLSPATPPNQPRHHGCGQRRLDRPHCRANMTPGTWTLLNHYIRPAEQMATTTNRDLGL